MTALATPPAEAMSSSDGTRFVGIYANLMPDEVLLGRRLRELQRRLAIGVAGLVTLLLLVYAVSWWQTERSHSDLGNEQHRAKILSKTVQNYQPLVNAQSEAAGITQTLASLMAGDLQWPALLAHLRGVAPSGTSLTSVTGSITAGTTTGSGSTAANLGGGGLAILNQTGQVVVGTLTITGSAKDKNSVAAFADKLTTIPGMAAPLVTSVSGAKGTITFSINALITSDALGGRFKPTTPGAQTGGK